MICDYSISVIKYMNSYKELGSTLSIERYDVFMHNFLAMLHYTVTRCVNQKKFIDLFDDLCSKVNFENEEQYVNEFEKSRIYVENIMTCPYGSCDLDSSNRRYMHHIIANMIASNVNSIRDLLIQKLKVWKSFLMCARCDNEDFKRVRRLIHALDIFPCVSFSVQQLSTDYSFAYGIQSVIEQHSLKLAQH